MQVNVNPANLSHPAIVEHYAAKSRAYHTGMRFALEALGIELPAPLKRKPAGRKRSADPGRATLWRGRRKALGVAPHSPA